MNVEKNPLGISLGVFPTEALLEEIAESGIRYIELSVHGEDPSRIYRESEAVRRLAGQYGLSLWSVHLRFGRETMNLCAPDTAERERSLRTQIEDLKGVSALGVKHAILHGGIPLPQTERKKYFKIAKENIATLQDEASALGIHICVESLMPSCIGRNSEELLSILSAHPDLRVCLDPNHILGEDHVHLIRALGKRIVTTHLSDYDLLEERHWMPGEGKIDWSALIGALDAVGYEGPLLYEVSPFRTPKSIERRPLSFKDYYENYQCLINKKTPNAIGTPIYQICEENTFANFCLQTYHIEYEKLMQVQI